MGHELGDTLTALWKLDPRTHKSEKRQLHDVTGDVTGGGLQMQDLCIVQGRSCFVIYIDATVLNVDGNILSAISFATRAALHKLPIPHVEVDRHLNF